jgi:hypothetical protein
LRARDEQIENLVFRFLSQASLFPATCVVDNENARGTRAVSPSLLEFVLKDWLLSAARKQDSTTQEVAAHDDSSSGMGVTGTLPQLLWMHISWSEKLAAFTCCANLRLLRNHHSDLGKVGVRY